MIKAQKLNPSQIHPAFFLLLYMFHKLASLITPLLIIISLFQPLSLSNYLIIFSLFVVVSSSSNSSKIMAKSGEFTSMEVEAGETSGARERSSATEKGKSPVIEAPLIGKGDRETKVAAAGGAGVKRGVGIIDFVVRLLAIAAVLAAAVAMRTTQQTLPFFTQFFQFQASYDDLPTFTYFVIANAITAAYLVLSLPFSIVTIVRPLAKAPRLVLVTFDAVAMTLTTSAAAAAAAIVYLAHNGNTNTNWIAICQQFDGFCQRSSGAVVASFIGVVLFIFLIILSAVGLKSH